MPPPAGSLLGVLSGSPSKSDPRLSSWTEPGTSAASDSPLELEGPERPTLSRSVGPCMSYRSQPPRLGPPSPGSISELPHLQLAMSFPCLLSTWGTCQAQVPAPSGPCTPRREGWQVEMKGVAPGQGRARQARVPGSPSTFAPPADRGCKAGARGCGAHWVGFWVPIAKRAQGAPTSRLLQEPRPTCLW